MRIGSLRSLALALALLALAPVLASCGPAYRGEPISGPLNISDPKVALGQQVFDRNCQECHPRTAAGLAPGITDKPLPGWLIKFQVRHGLGAMPSFSEERISERELNAVVAYISKLRKHRTKSTN
jgi:mono/diheme cytochrome c family protein